MPLWLSTIMQVASWKQSSGMGSKTLITSCMHWQDLLTGAKDKGRS